MIDKITPTASASMPSTASTDAQYFVHYMGWAKKWDEWVPSDRTLPITDETRRLKQQIAQELRQQRKAASNGSAKSSSRTKSGSRAAGQKRRASRASVKVNKDDDDEKEEDVSMRTASDDVSKQLCVYRVTHAVLHNADRRESESCRGGGKRRESRDCTVFAHDESLLHVCRPLLISFVLSVAG